jgi:hypothetical protein
MIFRGIFTAALQNDKRSDRKMRRRRVILVCMMFLLFAAGAIGFLLWHGTRTPGELRIISERQILSLSGDSQILHSAGNIMPLSQDGRFLKFVRVVNVEGDSGEPLWTFDCQSYMLDIVMGTERTLPFPLSPVYAFPTDRTIDSFFMSSEGPVLGVNLSAWWTGESSSRAILYYPLSGKMRPWEFDESCCVVLDQSAERLLVTTDTAGRDPGGEGPEPFDLHIITLATGAAEVQRVDGAASASPRGNKAILVNPAQKRLSVYDLAEKRTTNSIELAENYNGMAPFWTANGSIVVAQEDLPPSRVAAAVDDIAAWLNRPSYLAKPRHRTVIWKLEKGRARWLSDTLALAPAIGSDCIWVGDEPTSNLWTNVRMMDVATGREWRLKDRVLSDVVCVAGGFVVYVKKDTAGNGSLWLMQVEQAGK